MYIGKRVLNGDLVKMKMCFVISLNLVSLIIILLMGCVGNNIEKVILSSMM